MDIDSGFITANYCVAETVLLVDVEMSLRKDVKRELNDIRQHINEVRNSRAKDELIRRYAELLQSLVIEGD